MTKVKVSYNALNYFRLHARNIDLEVEAYLIGSVLSPEITVISKFCYPESYQIQTKSEVQWSQKDYERVFELANKQGKRVIGTIHSHPDWDAVLSPADYKSNLVEGFRILGICSVNKRRTKVRFWVNDSSLPCEIEYL